MHNVPVCACLCHMAHCCLACLQLWQAITHLKANQWQLSSIPSYAQHFEAQLAAGQPLDLPDIAVPLQPPGIAADLPFPQVISLEQS